MALGIAKHHHRRIFLIGTLLVALLGAGVAVEHRFTSSEDGKSAWQVAIDHMREDKDIREKLGKFWRASRDLFKDIHPPRIPP